MIPLLRVVNDGNKYATIKYKNIEIETRFYEIEIKELFKRLLRDIEGEDICDDQILCNNTKSVFITLKLQCSAERGVAVTYTVESQNLSMLSNVKFYIPFSEFMQIAQYIFE